jgi:DNA-binding GntR family transcriptional regulator
MIEALDNLDVAFSLLHSTTFSLPQRQTVADREHRDIVAAIANRDGPGAAAASRFHIRETQQARLALFNVSEAPN